MDQIGNGFSGAGRMGPSQPGERQPGFSFRNLRTFSSFKNRVFVIYFGGLLGQMAGMNMQMLARSYLIYQLTRDPVILGAMSLFHAVPMVVLSLYGGVLADRMQKKNVMLIGQIASAVVSSAVGLTLLTGYLSSENPGSWWVLAASSVCQGIIMALMMPSRQAILPEIVKGEELMNAISLNTMGMNVFRLFAPAAAGFLIAKAGYEAVYFTVSVMYVISTIFVWFLPLTSKVTKTTTKVLTAMKEGFSYLRKETTILIILAFTLAVTILAMPFQQMMPIFTEDVLNVGPEGMGVIMSVSAVGSMISSLVLASLPNKKRGLMMLGGNVILGVALAGFSFSEYYALSLVLIGFVGLGQMVQMALGTTLIQYYIDPAYLGRVMSIMMMQFGLMSFSTFIAGLLTKAFGIQWSMGGLALVLVGLSVIALIFFKRIRNLE
ncbi:MAG TPA: MFS transporter [Dehalococcoidia bacterium]|nr:MFS transporter [Dehalococcoidia bacterium]